jgi:replicative DNA helicase
METIDNLQKFGQSYQAKVVASLLESQPFLNQVSDITKKDFFELEADRWIVGEIVSYNLNNNSAPTLDVFKVKLSEVETDAQKKMIVDRLQQVYDLFGSPDSDFIKQEYLQFCKRQKLKSAIFQSVDLLQSGKYDEVGTIIQDALRAGLENNLGHDYFLDILYRLEDVKRNSVPTGWKPINELMDGGLGPGELGVVVAPSGIGKTWLLCKLGADAVAKGFNVLHYSLELSENYVGCRYDTIYTGIPLADLKNNKEEIQRKLKGYSARLMIKNYPNRGASVKTMKAHIDKLRAQGFIPHLIIVDYADLLKPVNKRDGLYAELGGVYEELRGMGGEIGVPIWTASQTNRGALEDEVIHADSIADSYAKVMTADFIMSVSRKDKDKLANTARVHVMKNRFGPDGLTFPTKMDTMRGEIEIYDAQSSNGIMATKESNNGVQIEKKLLHKKYMETMPTDMG